VAGMVVRESRWQGTIMPKMPPPSGSRVPQSRVRAEERCAAWWGCEVCVRQAAAGHGGRVRKVKVCAGT